MPEERIFHSKTGIEIPLVCIPKCRFCSKPVPDEYAFWEQCYDCTQRMKNHEGIFPYRPYAFEKAICGGMYVPDDPNKGMYGKMIIDMKNGIDHSNLISEVLKYVFDKEQNDEQFDLVVPIPKKDNSVGPGYLLGKRISDKLNLPFTDPLSFIKGMKSSKDVPGENKFDNAREKALLNDTVEITSKNILLVDDILTTCGTAHWCSYTLIEEGADTVYLLAACRNVRKQHLDFIGYEGRY